MPKKDAVAKVPDREAAIAGYGAYAQDGMTITKDEIAISYLSLLQSNSRQTKRDGGIPGAQEGHIFHAGTEELFDKLTLQFIARRHAFVEWIDRDCDGGGLVAEYEPNDPYVKNAIAKHGSKFGKIPTRDETFKDSNGVEKSKYHLVETFYVYAYVMNDEGTEQIGNPVIIPMQSSKITPYKNWINSLNSFKGADQVPPYAHRTVLSSVVPPKKDYYVYKFTPLNYDASRKLSENIIASLIPMPQGEALVEAAETFSGFIKDGRVTADLSDTQGDADAGDPTGGDEVPKGTKAPF
jgi:hypothetical protein